MVIGVSVKRRHAIIALAIVSIIVLGSAYSLYADGLRLLVKEVPSSITVNIIGDSENINDALSLDGLDTSYDPSPIDESPGGVFTITAQFTNSSEDRFSGVFFEVAILEGPGCPCTLFNADEGPGGIGSTVEVGNVASGQSFEVTFEIGLAQPAPFNFFVDALGIRLQ